MVKIEVNAREFRRLSQMRARAAARERVKAAAKDAAPKLAARPFPAQQKRRERDASYLGWLHEGLPCIACRILGPAPEEHAYIEAAHQKAQDADRGWNKRLGVRPHDRRSCALCAWHHRLGPTCCDPAQAKFWAVLGVDVISFCEALFAAFKEGRNGAEVVDEYSKTSYTRKAI